MLSKNQLKRYAKLKQKKYRDAEGLFIAEGEKLVEDLLQRGAEAECLVTQQPIEATSNYVQVDENDFKRLSSLDNPSGTLGVFKKPLDDGRSHGWILALDGLRDPGNMGTILRCADWFGLSRVICSLDTVDCFNPKAVQASMGSVANIPVDYCDLPAYLKEQKLPVFGTFMDGEPVEDNPLPMEGILVLGNEGQGIREETSAVIDCKVKISKHPLAQAESLNVATAAAIFMAALPTRT